jgi:hypothetical protein
MTVLETHTKNKKRGINEFEKDYQLRTNTAKDENGDLLTDSHTTLNR